VIETFGEVVALACVAIAEWAVAFVSAHWVWVVACLLIFLLATLGLELAEDRRQARLLDRALAQGADRRHDYRRTPERPWPEPHDIDR